MRRKIKKVSPLKKRSASYSPKSGSLAASKLNKKFAGSGTDSDAEKKTKSRKKKKTMKEVIESNIFLKESICDFAHFMSCIFVQN